MSRYQRRAIGWAFAAVVALLFWWVQSPVVGGTAAAPTVSVVVVARPLAAGDRITAADVAVRRVAYSRGSDPQSERSDRRSSAGSPSSRSCPVHR